MKTAIVSGASSGIGLEITRKLLDMGFRVYGLARDFSKVDLQNKNFICISIDISDMNALEKSVKKLLKTEKQIDLLVNNAGVGYFGQHQDIKITMIKQMVDTNLLAPMVLSKLLLRSIRKSKGWIINIGSTAGLKASPFGCAYAATKAGIRHFSLSLFEEIRKSGVRVVNISPDMTKSDFYKNADFKEAENEEAYLTTRCIADMLETILNQREYTVITDITMNPQKHQIYRKKAKT
ncbi:MAG: SDR family NAD(P)-dependent oxidoreductase [Clostridia bacterium]|nr:SDR family NAD(P)-dependent oxidoreductase [Clostridia bacterium]